MPDPATLSAGCILASLVLYALFGGADFGGGVWDLLARGSRAADRRRLTAFPRDEWPDPVPVHLAFQAMVAGGTVLALLAVAAAWRSRKKRENLFDRRFLIAVALCGPIGLLCVEAGWGVTEMGRQPWAIRGVMRTAEAVTPVGGLLLPFAFFSLLYLGLGAATVWLLRHEFATSPFFPARDDVADPTGPEGRE